MTHQNGYVRYLFVHAQQSSFQLKQKKVKEGSIPKSVARQAHKKKILLRFFLALIIHTEYIYFFQINIVYCEQINFDP